MTMVELQGRLTISVPEAGQILGIGRDSAYRAAERGEIPTLRLGHRLRVPVPALLALLGALTITDGEAGPRQEPATASTSPPPRKIGPPHDHAASPQTSSIVNQLRRV